MVKQCMMLDENWAEKSEKRKIIKAKCLKRTRHRGTCRGGSRVSLSLRVWVKKEEQVDSEVKLMIKSIRGG